VRRAVFLTLLIAATAALAQPPPPRLEPLPEPPPPPPMPGPDEPSVRIPVQEGAQVEEVRRGGRVVAVKVTPPGGRPFFLIDPDGSGDWVRRDSLDEGLRVPMWPILEFD
jgi:uncharacterized protein DUF2782